MTSRLQDKTKEILDSIWCDDYYIIAARESAPSADYLRQFAKEHGVKFSDEYIAHSSNFYGGLYLEVKEEIWPRAGVGSVGPFWSFLYGIYTFAYSDDAPEWLNINTMTAQFSAMGHKVVPILKVISDSDVYCFNDQGEIVRWSHEEDIFNKFEGSFFDLLAFEVKELDERRKHKKELKS